VRTLCASPDELRARWATPASAPTSSAACRARDDFQQVAAQAGKPDARPVRPAVPPRLQRARAHRRQRADRLKQQHVAFFKFFAPEAREILNDLLEKYASGRRTAIHAARRAGKSGRFQTTGMSPKLPAFWRAEKLGNAVTQLQSLLYAA